MTPDRINELIPIVHEAAKDKWGWWDGAPKVHPMKAMLDGLDYDAACDAYSAGLLDLITEAIVDAMRARREGKRGALALFLKKNKWLDGHLVRYTPSHEQKYDSFILNTHEDHLALALLRVLDLMGFYGVEYDEYNSVAVTGDLPVPQLRRIMAANLHDAAYRTHTGIPCNSAEDLGGKIMHILRIAELDNIDIEWYLEARMRYQEVK